MVSKRYVTTPYLIPELCQFCKKRPVHFTGHGMRKGVLYDEFSCVVCYARKGHMSESRATQLIAELKKLELKSLPAEVLPDPDAGHTPDLPEDSPPEVLEIPA